MRSSNSESVRVAFFPDAYHEVDGIANTSRHFEAFANNRDLPFLTIHAGPRKEIITAGSGKRVQLPRSPLAFPLDRTHEYDPAFWRHYREAENLVREFEPDVVHITGPSDVGMLGALIAHRLGVPLAANWQTNLHQYAGCRLARAFALLPKSLSSKLSNAGELAALRGLMRFYRIPRILFAPNREIVTLLQRKTDKPCFLMSHSVNTAAFSPAFRNREAGPCRIGYVGRLTAEKNVRRLAQIERGLLARGRSDFRFIVVGGGAERKWLERNLRQADFTGVLRGKDLSQAFANMDLFLFPSETDTFGLVVLEALASGVPPVVSSYGGPKYTVQHCKTGYVANSLDEFVAFTDRLLSKPDLRRSMGAEARAYALSTSWERIFEGLYETYERCFFAANVIRPGILELQNCEPDPCSRLG